MAGLAVGHPAPVLRDGDGAVAFAQLGRSPDEDEVIDLVTSTGSSSESESSQTGTTDVYEFEDVAEDGTASTETRIEVFRVSYENGEAVVTVESDDEDRVVAPGTENDYTFCLKNNTTAALSYTMSVEAYFTPADVQIPVETRMKNYDGDWLVGGASAWEEFTALDGVEDAATLSANSYAYYTLEWQWPFESGDDEYDTLLGNTAVDEDLTLTVVIRTVAEQDVSGDAESSGSASSTLSSVKTGLTSHLGQWLAVMGVAILILLILLIAAFRRRKEEEDEGKTTNRRP